MNSFGYKLFLLLHILAVIVAFSPAFVWAFSAMKLKKAGKDAGPAIGEMAEGQTMRIYGPALVLAGVFGFGLVGLSDKVWTFGQTWVSVAMLLWFLALGVQFGIMVPAEKLAAAGDPAGVKKTSMAGGMLHGLLVLLLIMMVWKPGV